MDYLDLIKSEKMKLYMIDDQFSSTMKDQKRSLEEGIDQYIKENNLYFSSEPTELERLEFLNLINDFIDSQAVDEEIKKNDYQNRIKIRYVAFIKHAFKEAIPNSNIKLPLTAKFRFPIKLGYAAMHSM